ncbi:prepilin-type N-terminal cleavage/methylation domain-containing protein [Virgibacillus byunsanensis]|uniref:Prepilin-type N-terminal cleavage/methylation domain-containing protein n=1 Tax=Virgibacillus byunsanensis TaxID=570945 RepID=A0ABW3LKF1_9BACI
MLTRMKKILKREKGFTLVELLAVIAILAIITAIAVPTIGNVIGDSEEKAHEANVKLIENAARLAYIGGLDEVQDGNVTINELVENDYLDDVPQDVGDHEYNEDHVINNVSESGATF